MSKKKQKHDFHSFLERSVSKLLCHAQQVEYAAYDTRYDLYEEVVMHGEILWDTHLWAVFVRQQIHTFKHNCPLCGQGITSQHFFLECPFAMWYALYVHIKLSLLIPSLLPSWKHCFPTPWGVWIHHVQGSLILTIRPVVGLEVPHQLIHVSPTGH